MKQRLYLDTSVFGGFFDEEFSEFTQPLFERLRKGEFKLLFSSATQEELEEAPNEVKSLVKSLKEEFTEFIATDNEAVELASQYIIEKVVGKTSFADCLHIALATIYRADFLISWNFKHIVNIKRIQGYNAVNIKNGYKELEIRSPREFINYEDNN
ncbi:MAG: PIN domain-containing protein [Lentimicrobium sp.]|jgi:predicted nucleic acid-binding protein|nr:PIN domain-containing protein [Lentimicrobium sp.]